jgi:hypothetical protein
MKNLKKLKELIKELRNSWKEYSLWIPNNKNIYESMIISCTCKSGIITCPGCDGDKESQFGICAGCNGIGMVTCGKCNGKNNL